MKTTLSTYDKVQYAIDLEGDGENGAAYLASQYNKYCLLDILDDVSSRDEVNIIERALLYVK